MPSIFISYARDDERFVRQLATSLSEAGVNIWLDVDQIPSGVNWSSAVQKGLDDCNLLILIISQKSMKSHNVEDEWQYFIDKHKPIIPVQLEEVDRHFQLGRLQYIDFKRQSFDKAFGELQQEINRKLVAPSADITSVLPAEVPSSIITTGDDKISSGLIKWLEAVVSRLTTGGVYIGLIRLVSFVLVSAIIIIAILVIFAPKIHESTAPPTVTHSIVLTNTAPPTYTPDSRSTPSNMPSFTSTYTASPTLTIPPPAPTSSPTFVPMKVETFPIPNTTWLPIPSGATQGFNQTAIFIKPSVDIGQIGDLYGTFNFGKATALYPRATYYTVFSRFQDWSKYKQVRLKALFQPGISGGTIKATIELWTGSKPCYYEHGGFQVIEEKWTELTFELNDHHYKNCQNPNGGYHQPLVGANEVIAFSIVIIPVPDNGNFDGAVAIQDVVLVQPSP